MFRLALAATLAAGLVVGPASGQASDPVAADVPAYRGDLARTGRMPGPCPTGEPTLGWRAANDAPFASAPVVAQGLVILADDLGRVQAYEIATGALRWERDLGSLTRPSPPAVAGTRVMVGDGDGVLHALEVTDGAPVWDVTLDGPIAGSPAVVDDLVVAATDTSSYRLDASTGEVRHRDALPGPATRSIAVAAETAYVPAGRSLVAQDLASGAVRWEHLMSSDGAVGTPAVVDDLVIAATGLGLATPAAHGVTALDAATGEHRWRYVTPEEAVIFGPAVDDRGRAFVVGHDSRVVSLDTRTGEPLWVAQLTSIVDTAPVVACGLLYVATAADGLLILDPHDGSEIAHVPFRGRPGGVVVTGGVVVIPTYVGELQAFADAGGTDAAPMS
jgi:outer membrane protein assembly factor BamB